MATGNRRPRSDSVSAAVTAFRHTAAQIEWPELEVSRLPRADDDRRAQAIFDRIISSRAPGDWRQHDPVLIAQLSVVQVELDKIMSILAAEGWTSFGGKNGDTRIRSPLIDPAQHLSTRALALSRALGITGDPAGDKRGTGNRAQAVADARATGAASDDSHGLLA
jgi:hypothetical protein